MTCPRGGMTAADLLLRCSGGRRGAAEGGQFGAAFVGPAGHEQHRAGLSPLSQAPGYRSRDEAPGAGMSSPASSGVASVLPAGASGHDQAGSYAQDGL